MAVITTDSRHMLVVFWREGRKYLFLAHHDWTDARSCWQAQAEVLKPGSDITSGLLLADAIFHGRAIIQPDRRQPAGLVLAPKLDVDGQPAAFGLAVKGANWVAAIGSGAAIARWAATGRTRAPEAKCLHASPASSVALADRRIRKDSRKSVAAEIALNEVVEHGMRGAAREAVMLLPVPEMIWVAMALGDRKDYGAVLAVADGLEAGDESVQALNLRASAFRLMGLCESARDAAKASLALCRNAESNPMGHIQMAAALRKLGEHDSAYDHMKMVRRYYPGDDYVIRMLAALDRDRVGPQFAPVS